MKNKTSMLLTILFITLNACISNEVNIEKPLSLDFIKNLLPKQLFIKDSKVVYLNEVGEKLYFNIDFAEEAKIENGREVKVLSSVMQNDEYYFNLNAYVYSTNNPNYSEIYSLIYDFIDNKSGQVVNRIYELTNAYILHSSNVNDKTKTTIHYENEEIAVIKGLPTESSKGCKEMYFSFENGIVVFTDRNNIKWQLVGFE